MLDESQLDEFLDEFFGEEKPASDAARLKNSGKQNPFHRKEVPSEELEEYTSVRRNDYPPDGAPGKGKPPHLVCICGHADRGTNPSILLGEDMGRRKYLLCSLIVVMAAMLPFFYDV